MRPQTYSQRRQLREEIEHATTKQNHCSAVRTAVRNEYRMGSALQRRAVEYAEKGYGTEDIISYCKGVSKEAARKLVFGK